jgi:hypothetical protein
MKLKLRLAAMIAVILVSIAIVSCTTTTVQKTEPANQKPNIVALDAKPAEITKGSATTLSWNVSGATRVAFDQKIGDVQPSGKISVTPDTNTIYVLTASNNNGSVSQTVKVKVNQAGSASQSGTRIDTTGNTASSMSQPQALCRDGECTFIYGKLFSIVYPDTWKSMTLSTNKIGLFQKDSYSADIEIEVNDPIGTVPLKRVADQYVKEFLSRGNNSFYVGTNEALTKGPWDWFIDTSFSLGGFYQHIRVYYKNTDSHLYQLRAFATRHAAEDPFTSDYNKIINSFQLQQ